MYVCDINFILYYQIVKFGYQANNGRNWLKANKSASHL
jgi:hypothetical protein